MDNVTGFEFFAVVFLYSVFSALLSWHLTWRHMEKKARVEREAVIPTSVTSLVEKLGRGSN